MEHQVTLHRHELRRRRLTVKAKQAVTPAMVRVILEGDDLDGFVSLAPDDHVKLFVPTPSGEVERRDYTPRSFDRAARTLAIDFAMHDAGPAAAWAMAAVQGDTLEIGGPRGSRVVSPDFDWWLLVGDETALPAIGRRIEELPPGVRVTSIVAVANRDEEQVIATAATHEPVWVHRPHGRAGDPEPLLAALRSFAWPMGDGFVWIAAEGRVARALRDDIVRFRNHPPGWMKAAGYWLKGVADAHDKLRD